MNTKQKIFAVISSILIVLIIDNFFIHYLFPMKRANFFKERTQEVQDSLKAHPPAEEIHAVPDIPKASDVPLTDFKSAAQDCLGGSWTSADTIADELTKAYGVQSKNRDIENIHFKNSSGEERRIHVIMDSPDKKQIRFFSVDDEGLPVPIALTAEQRHLDPESLMQNLLGDGKVFFRQTKERWLLGNGSSFMVTFENGQTQEFQIFGPTKTLSCLGNSCQCL